MSFSSPVAGGSGQLIRDVLKSVNYMLGLAGWQITRDGDAEFNNLSARGTFEVSDPDGSKVEVIADNGAKINLHTDNVANVTEDFPGSVFASYTGNANFGYASVNINSPESTANGESLTPGSFLIAGEIAGGSPWPDMDTAGRTYAAWNGDMRIDGQLNVTDKIKHTYDNMHYVRGYADIAIMGSIPNGATAFTKSVTFSTPFPALTKPVISGVLLEGASGQLSNWTLRVNNVTNTGFDIVGSRSVATTLALTNVPIHWVAMVAEI